jgi:hypothetical protein
MVVEACRRLIEFAPLGEYQYVGFGGIEFLDFSLFHRSLGIHKMTSIEMDTNAAERFKYNVPFRSIKLIMGQSSEVLTSDVDWGGLSIIWLDYTDRLNESVLSDTELVCSRIRPGSVLFVTMNAHNPAQRGSRRQTLASAIGEDLVPIHVTDDSLARWGLAAVQRHVITETIQRTLTNRQHSGTWNQILNVFYADGANMQTLGGVVTDPATSRCVQNCRFEELEFIRTDEDPIILRVPFLTPKERRALDEQLPQESGRILNSYGLDEKDVDDYLTIYRYAHLADLRI